MTIHVSFVKITKHLIGHKIGQVKFETKDITFLSYKIYNHKSLYHRCRQCGATFYSVPPLKQI